MQKRLSLIKPSTREFVNEARKVKGYTLFDLVHGYIYARWSHFYIGTGIGTRNKWLSRGVFPVVERIGRLLKDKPRPAEETIEFADTYHGKAVPLKTATQLVSVRESINLGDLEKVIPYKKARDLIFQNPDHIAVLDCPCRVARENPCLPLDVCLVIGEPFAGFIIEHQPQRARWITSDEAAKILEEEDARGHVHHAFFKDAMLGRFYAICNCCSCCCGAMQAHRNGTPMLASSGYLAQVDEALCIQCGECEATCQFGALAMGENAMQVDSGKCMGCGVCVSHCAQDAIRLELAPEKGMPLELEKLIEEAAQAAR